MSRVILFGFYGRRANMEIQLPFISRILEENPNVQFDAWNITSNPGDDEFVRSIQGEHVVVHNQLQGVDPWIAFNQVYKHYTAERYKDCLFGKIDDDVLFLETDRFAQFVDAIDRNRNQVISAMVVNNGACTRYEPGLWQGYEGLEIPLLDVHMHASYADMSHNYFFDNWQSMINQPVELKRCEDWLSINVIGYDWQMGCMIATMVGGRSPRRIAGRRFRLSDPLGDEGMVNTLPRLVMKGFLAGHLTFGPQHIPDEVQTMYRKRYAEIGREYLGD